LIEATAEYGLFFIYSRFTRAHRRGKSLVSIRRIGVTMMTMMKNVVVVVVKGSLSRERKKRAVVVRSRFPAIFCAIQTPKKQRKTFVAKARNDQM
jgi:hypothetical protein